MKWSENVIGFTFNFFHRIIMQLIAFTTSRINLFSFSFAFFPPSGNGPLAVADPGFPVGGGANSRGNYVSKKLYVKRKESGPLGGHAPAAPPGSANA